MAVNYKPGALVNCLAGRLTPAWNNCCLLCGGAANIDGLCDPCCQDLPGIHYFCLNCSIPLDSTAICGKCLNGPAPPWLYVYAAYNYAYPVSRLIQRMKYYSDMHAAHVLGLQTAHALKPLILRHGRPDVILPVPLHTTRLGYRGYNQAQLIAQTIGHLYGIAVNPLICQRTRNTRAQASLDAVSRKRNLKDAFVCHENLCQGKSIAVVDDVITTASTVREISQTLARAGAATVQVWAVARQQLHR